MIVNLLGGILFCALLIGFGCSRRAEKQALEDAEKALQEAVNDSISAPNRALCALLEDYSDDSLPRVEALLKIEKADPNCFCDIVVFHERNRFLNKIPIVERYVSDGVDLSENTDPLQMALSLESWPLVELLTAHGVNLNGGNGHISALNTAIRNNDLQAVDKLVKLGADPKLASLYLVSSKKMTDKLLKLGCPASAIGLQGALRAQDIPLVDYLLTLNPKPAGELDAGRAQFKDENAINLLHHLLDQDDRPEIEIQWNANSFAEEVLENDDCETFGRLVKRGLQVNEFDGAMPYMNSAIIKDDSATVGCLLRHGAATTDKDFNAMEKAIWFKAKDCVYLLNSKGIKVRTGENLDYARDNAAKPEIIAILSK